MTTDAYHTRIEPGTPGAPLFFVFHGTGGDENQFPDLARRMLPDATIVSPRGDVSEHGAARFFRRTAEGVYDMADLARATAKLGRHVAAHAAEADHDRVFALGYSNGANILASLQFAEPTLFDRTVLMHPLIPFEPAIKGTLDGRRILITAGKRDPICPPALVERLETALRSAGASVETLWHSGGHEVRPEEIDAAQAFLRA